MYKYLLFDADHTLIDYTADERVTFRTLLSGWGLPTDDETLRWCNQISERSWTAAGLYDVHNPVVQKEYHRLYRSHAVHIFEKIFQKFGVQADTRVASQRFLLLLEERAHLLEGAEDVLQTLSKQYTLCLATNGLKSIQVGRTREIIGYFKKLYVSEELGVIKPLPAFFEGILSDLGAKKEECLMIGDSLSSDIAGANAVGMDCVWLNRKGKENDTPFSPTYEITSLREIFSILCRNR